MPLLSQEQLDEARREVKESLMQPPNLQTAIEHWKSLPEDAPMGERLDAFSRAFEEFLTAATTIEVTALSNLPWDKIVQAKLNDYAKTHNLIEDKIKELLDTAPLCPTCYSQKEALAVMCRALKTQRDSYGRKIDPLYPKQAMKEDDKEVILSVDGERSPCCAARIRIDWDGCIEHAAKHFCQKCKSRLK